MIYSLDSVRNLGGFSARVFAASVLSWGDQNIDKALVGRFLGAAPLGAYSLAYNAMLLPMTILGRPFNQVLTPAFSRIQGDAARLERVWLRSKRLSSALISPTLLALIVVAPDAVPVVFGDQWEEAVLPLQLLCIGGLARSLTHLQWSVLQARGEASTLLWLTAVSSAVKYVAIIAGLPWGIVGVAAFFAGSRWLLVLPTTWFAARAVSFRFWPALRAGAEMIPLAIVAGAVGFGARRLLLETGMAQGLRLIVVAATMLIAYTAVLLVAAPFVLRELRQVVRRRGENPGTVGDGPPIGQL